MDQNTISSSTGSITTASVNISPEKVSIGEFDFSDVVLNYINQILMEDTTEERNCLLPDSSALQAAEKTFYEILGKKYPTPPDCNLDNNNAVETNWIDELHEYISLSQTQSFPSDFTFQETTELSYNHSDGFHSAVERPVESPVGKVQLVSDVHCESELIRQQSTPQLSYNHSTGFNPVVKGLVESPMSKVHVRDVYGESEFMRQYKKGVEEANKFLPSGNNLILNFESNDFLYYERNKESNGVVVELEKRDGRDISTNGSRRKKNACSTECAISPLLVFTFWNKNFNPFTSKKKVFDMVLVSGEKEEQAESIIRKSFKVEASKKLQQNGGKTRGKKQTGKAGAVDLWSLLIQYAQGVAADDRRTANELLKQLRQHSSPSGDGLQRLSHCFTDGLEARLDGSGSQIYSILPQKSPSSVIDMLKAYQLFMAAIPFTKISNFFANQTINDLVENANTTLHIVDFGILYGGPPKLKITGIELPRPGFRPVERVEETGSRLKDYAEEFNVPFEYHAIAQKWETIQLKDLKINKGELLVANYLFRYRNLLDESVVLDSPRNVVLNLIRKMNPDLFIHGILNGTYNSPFFVPRFREALFHFSTLFDVLKTTVPRENAERITIQRDLLGKEALNIIACEGSKRKVKEQAKADYHKDFVVDEDNRWMLLGWKGRIIFALSYWRPV
ncbi:hypothetical protein MKW94_006348 [Papaver nudicaule]|uniref:GRAS family transcription factor n=1 Tax=Papaver nudicaule TaxID=74823 RepID=A0AA41RUW4_PAPNU|nr:hypothetical protein [Papaver nudicaule]